MLAPYLEKSVKFIKKFLFNLFRSQYRIQTFTYYIPAPPPRKTGYREKEFDKLFYSFINKGHEILSVNTQGHSGPQGAGMWVMFTVRATSEASNYLNLNHPEEAAGNSHREDRPLGSHQFFTGPEITFGTTEEGDLEPLKNPSK